MAEVEITTTGEVKLNGDVVGKITYSRPYVEAEIAGVFDTSDGYQYEPWGCDGCYDLEVEKDELECKVDELEGKVIELVDERDALKDALAEAERKGSVACSS